MTTTPETIDTLKPGQSIRCTIAKTPRAKAPRETIARLMRLDPENAKGLRHAQVLRSRRMNAYIRGNRLWHSREKAARVVRVANGESWNLAYTPILGADLKSVAAYLTIEKA
jgi:hypothetical protein